MKFTKDSLEIKEALKNEWILTNGMGGYSSSTIIGANTRKYHGLLVAPLTPPARRFLILSKLDESILVGQKVYNLYTNMCPNYISEGFKYQTEFEKGISAKFKYQIKDIEVEKNIAMKYLENTVCVKYRVKTKKEDVKLTLAPILNFRDFHTMSTNKEFSLKQEMLTGKVKIVVDEHNDTPIYIRLSDGDYIKHDNDVFRNMYYLEEEKRGFFPEENHIVPGRYEVIIPRNTEKEISFICSLQENIEEIQFDKIVQDNKLRTEKVVKNSKIEINKDKKGELVEALIRASDEFIVYRPAFRLHTVIAGYPWFLDWGRDTLISFEGLFLTTKRFDLAKEILFTIIRDVKFGLVPNGYSGFDNRPLYNSVDSSLLLFEQVSKYLRYTGDYEFIKEKIYPVLKVIIENYTNGIDLDDNNIYLDQDGLLVCGTENTQNTWMDAKIGNYTVTPRNGKVVEINALWYNALKVLENLSKEFEDTKTQKNATKLAKRCKKEFENKFYNKRKKCLYDVIGDSKARPNQIFALALTYPILEGNQEISKEVFDAVTKKLLKPYGLKTLAKGEQNYVEVYEGDSFRRDMSYHQGITWVWLLGMYSDAFKNIIKWEKSKTKQEKLEKEYNEFLEKLVKTFYDETLLKGCIGQVPEMFDSKAPYSQKGTFAQSWSVAELLRVLTEK